MATIELKDVVKRFGTTTIVHGINLTINEGEFVVLVGPSGCGKSTTLRMIAGLEDISEGTIAIDGRVVNELEPKERNIAMVFQNYAIYPHVSVAENIGFGLYTSQLGKAEKRRRIEEVAATLGLTPLLDRRPNQLSGGQRQRVAIGRAMVRDPAAFLFDEPLSNLDAQLRGQMRLEIKRLQQDLKATSVFVTHDQVEAMTMADRIVVMREGRILQVGTPMELYNKPVDVFTARFIGSPSMNLLRGKVAGGSFASEKGLELTLPALPVADGSDILLGLRPHALIVADKALGATMEAKVHLTEVLGAETLVHCMAGGETLTAVAPPKMNLQAGDTVTLGYAPTELHAFDAKMERTLRRD